MYGFSLSSFVPTFSVVRKGHVTYNAFWLLQALKINNYDAEPMLRSCGVSINSNFTQVEGRVLPPPKVYFLAY